MRGRTRATDRVVFTVVFACGLAPVSGGCAGGFFFQPLDSQTGAPLPSPEWLDTYNVPQHAMVQLAIKFDDRPGMWMFHCHILDHADAGMMGMLQLAP